MFVLLPFLLPFLPFYALDLFFSNIISAFENAAAKISGIFDGFSDKEGLF